MSLHLNALAEVIQHQVSQFYQTLEGEDLPTIVIIHLNGKIELLPMFGDIYEILDTLSNFTAANSKINIAGVAAEAYMQVHRAEDKEKALRDYDKTGGVDRDKSQDSIIIHLWERGTNDKYLTLSEIDKETNTFKGGWIESISSEVGGEISKCKVFP